MKVSLLTLVTSNFEGLKQFYQRLLDIEPTVYRERYAEFDLSGVTLGIWRSSEAQDYGLPPVAPEDERGGVILELEVQDIDHEYDRVQTLGVQLLTGIHDQPWGHRTFYFRDPDGNIVNFFAQVDPAAFEE